MRRTEVTFTHAAPTRLQANTHFTSGLIFHYQSEEYACAAEKRNTRPYTLSQYAAHLGNFLLRLGGLCICRSIFYRDLPFLRFRKHLLIFKQQNSVAPKLITYLKWTIQNPLVSYWRPTLTEYFLQGQSKNNLVCITRRSVMAPSEIHCYFFLLFAGPLMVLCTQLPLLSFWSQEFCPLLTVQILITERLFIFFFFFSKRKK